MAKIIKSEWHQVELRYSVELSKELLKSVYPEKNEQEINQVYDSIIEGNTLVEEVIDDAEDFDWEFDREDMWTERKGGYDVTYDLDLELSAPINWEPANKTDE